MSLQIESWQMVQANAPQERASSTFQEQSLAGDSVLVEVAGCGVCHTDLGFLYDGVRTRKQLPLTLGHEISGRVVHAGPDAEHLLGKAVVVPAVIPCGSCDPCRRGRGAICQRQFFPGNDDHGGFATHVQVPGRGLCVVEDETLAASGIDLASLSVIADAVTTPFQAIVNAGLRSGDVAVFIGVGGVGAFGVQIASAMGAHVVAIDVAQERLDLIAQHGAELQIVSTPDARSIKQELRGWVKDQGYPTTGWKIFETSGNPAGQRLAYSLLGYDAHLAIVGYTREKIEVRLSNLMAFDATARGTWGCLPEFYPEVVELVLSGAVKLTDFVQRFPMSEINQVFAALHAHELSVRPILIPDF